MHDRWNEIDAAACSSPLELRAYSSRLLGLDPALVLHGGGNTSVKTRVPNLFGEVEDILYVKGSGWDLATIAAAGFAPVRLEVLRRMAGLTALTDSDMVHAQRAAMIDPNAPTPSIEAILHAIIPFDFVDHTHADAVVTVSNTSDGERRIRRIYGDDVLVLPYVMPGFALARLVRQQTMTTDWSRLQGIVLLHHGIFSFGPDAHTSYERMIALVRRAEQHLDQHGALAAPARQQLTSPLDQDALLSLARLRHVVGTTRGGPMVARLDRSPDAVGFASRSDAPAIATRGPLTPDHVIRTKPVPLVADGDWVDTVAGFAERYREYFARHAT
ncbi:MAG: class II aldolase/adducin family protein, partial [Gemmatimonadales bacterium]